jgi:hypothetical protein
MLTIPCHIVARYDHYDIRGRLGGSYLLSCILLYLMHFISSLPFIKSIIKVCRRGQDQGTCRLQAACSAVHRTVFPTGPSQGTRKSCRKMGSCHQSNRISGTTVVHLALNHSAHDHYPTLLCTFSNNSRQPSRLLTSLCTFARAQLEFKRRYRKQPWSSQVHI